MLRPFRISCSNLRVGSRSYSAAVAQIYTDRKWLVKRMPYPDLPKREKSQVFKKQFGFNLDHVAPANHDVYSTDTSFKADLDKAMQQLFVQRVKANTDAHDAKLKNMAWLRLRNYIYMQLKDESLLKQLEKFTFPQSQLIRPSQPNMILLQLLSCDKVLEKDWNFVCTSNQVQDKYLYLLTRTFDYIHDQEVLPFQTPSTSKQKLDISNPVEWFPETRKMKRKIIMHLGPTNSGKTFKALQKLKQVDRGYYAGPLRLLAREIYDKFHEEGIRCNLLTGEEVIQDLNDMGNPAGLTSGTVEMIPLKQVYDAVVLDEIQMMSDPDRGWAWTNALLGVKAKEVHLCGEKSVLPVVQKIIAMTGDDLVVNEYERLGKLEVEANSLCEDLSRLRRGDCIVAFSKKKILDIKLQIQKQTKWKVAVIYGSLPPETRRQQANLFNSREYDILVASDAIGMGLNLSIERVIFYTGEKYNGKEVVSLSSSNIKQIGGRAGRFKDNDSGVRPTGYITSFSKSVLPSIREGIGARIKYLKNTVVWPTDPICLRLMNKLPPGTKLSEMLELIDNQVTNTSNNTFVLSDLKNKMQVISLFEHMDDISFLDKLKLSNAPVKDMPLVKKAFVQFCETVAKRQTRTLLSYPLPWEILDHRCIWDDKASLEMYEAVYNIIMLFYWLSNRYPNYFIDIESAKDMRTLCELIIFEKLDRLKRNPYQKYGATGLGAIYKQRSKLHSRHTASTV